MFKLLKMNGLELKFLWSIPTIGEHVPTKGNIKIDYFMASIFVQIGLPRTLTPGHGR